MWMARFESGSLTIYPHFRTRNFGTQLSLIHETILMS